MIKYKYNGQEYILEFDRASVEILEKTGFSMGTFTDHIATMQPLLFRGAFFKNHKFAKNLDYEKMWDEVKNKKKFTNALLDMVAETYQTLMSDEETDEGNENWEVV